MVSAEVVGLYEVDGPEPCHLVEMLIRDSMGPFDIGSITQSRAGVDRSDWQVPYDEKIVTPDGTGVALDPWTSKGDESAWLGDVRLVFFVHYLDCTKALETPFGPLPLPYP